MEGIKPLILSRAFWSAVIGMAGLVPGLGKHVAGFSPDAFVEASGQALALAGFISSIYFRKVATKQIG